MTLSNSFLAEFFFYFEIRNPAQFLIDEKQNKNLNFIKKSQ